MGEEPSGECLHLSPMPWAYVPSQGVCCVKPTCGFNLLGRLLRPSSSSSYMPLCFRHMYILQLSVCIYLLVGYCMLLNIIIWNFPILYPTLSFWQVKWPTFPTWRWSLVHYNKWSSTHAIMHKCSMEHNWQLTTDSVTKTRFEPILHNTSWSRPKSSPILNQGTKLFFKFFIYIYIYE